MRSRNNYCLCASPTTCWRRLGIARIAALEMSDAEIITTAVCAAMFFDGNHSKACIYMKDHNLIPHMLEKSRFNRRLHGISMLINDLFHQIGIILKEASDCTEYLLDSFPVAMCDNIRIFNVKLIKSEEYRGYIASKKRYFYGVRVQLLTTTHWCSCWVCVDFWLSSSCGGVRSHRKPHRGRSRKSPGDSHPESHNPQLGLLRSSWLFGGRLTRSLHIMQVTQKIRLIIYVIY